MTKVMTLAKGGSWLPLILGLILGLIAAVLVVVVLTSSNESDGTVKSGGSVGGVQVVVAAQDIAAGTKLTPQMLGLKTVRASDVLAKSFTTTEGVANQITTVPLVAGEQVLATKLTASGIELARFGADAPLSLVVPEGKRAFSIAISEVGSANGLVRAGDYVDVLLSGAKSVEGGETFLSPGSACYVLQDVEVLAVGATLKNVAPGPDGSAGAASGTNAGAVSATLAVTPEEVWWLAAAQQSVNGSDVGNQLWISLRPFGEHGEAAGLPNCGVIPGT